jgi:hypothetical protein
LSLRQRLQFWEMLAFYLNGFTAFVYIASILASLLGVPPLTAGAVEYSSISGRTRSRSKCGCWSTTCPTTIAAASASGSFRCGGQE